MDSLSNYFIIQGGKSMDKYEDITRLIEKIISVKEMRYIIDGRDKNPIYLVQEDSTDNYMIVTYYREELQIVFEIKLNGQFDEIWIMLTRILSAYERHND